MSDLYLFDQRDAVEAALDRETAAWERESDGVALLEAYHAHWEPERWDDYALFVAEPCEIRDWMFLAVKYGDGRVESLDIFHCDQCGHEELLLRQAYDEEHILAAPDTWQILVPEGESPWSPGAIVNCSGCVVAREQLTTEQISAS